MDKSSPQYKKYLSYIASQEFKSLKVDLILVRGCKCEKCGKPGKDPRHLDLHHKTYKNLYNESPEDLILLCGTCHQIEHGLIKVKSHTPEKKHPAKPKFVKPVKKKNLLRGFSKRDKALQLRYDNLRQPGKLAG